MADSHNLAASTVAEEKEGPLGEKQKIVFRNSDETLQGRESQSDKPSPGSDRLAVTFSQKLDENKLRVDEPQTAVIGGKYINEEGEYKINT